MEGFYYNDKEIGVWTKKDRDGRVYQERIYYDTTRSKVQINDYYLNGNLKSMGFLFPAPYRDTVMQYDEKLGRDRRFVIDSMLMKSGRWSFYHSNGILESEGLYEKNAKKGIWKFYNQNGELIRTEDL
jgi:antitoxin component YwqK of YwqJK toxin-antitoxin module